MQRSGGNLNMAINRRGIASQFVILIVMGIILFCLFAFWWAYSLIGPPILNTIDNAVTTLSTSQAGNQNISDALNATIVPVNRSLGNLEWISYSLPIMLLLVFILMCSYARSYPFLLPVWLAICAILVFSAIVLSAGFENSTVNDGALYAGYEANNFFITYMPHMITAIGIIGGFVLLIIVSRDKEAEAQVI